MPSINNAMYNDFINHCIKQRDYYLAEIHSIYTDVHYYYNEIMKHVSLLRTKGIKVSNPITKYSKISIDGVWDLPKELHNGIKTYNYIGYDKIDTLIEYYTYYDRMSYIPDFQYNAIQKIINRNIVNAMVDGEIYTFGSTMEGCLQTEPIDGKIGSIYIKEVVLTKDVISKAKSFHTHNLNLELDADSKMIPIYHGEGSVFYKWKWKMIGIADYCKKYAYRISRTSQSVNKVLHLSTEEARQSVKLSGFIKMCIALHNDPAHKYKYQHKK